MKDPTNHMAYIFRDFAAYIVETLAKAGFARSSAPTLTLAAEKNAEGYWEFVVAVSIPKHMQGPNGEDSLVMNSGLQFKSTEGVKVCSTAFRYYLESIGMFSQESKDKKPVQNAKILPFKKTDTVH